MTQVRSVNRAFEILDLLAGHHEGLVMAEIRRKLKIPLSTLFSILNSLVYKNCIYRDSLSMRYHLGWKIASLSSQLNQNDLILRVALPVINEKIRPRCEETVTMTILDGRDILFIYVNQGNSKNLQVVPTVGNKLPAYATGSGRSMLAFLPIEQVHRIYPEDTFNRLTHRTKTSKKELLDDLKLIQQKGYIYDEEESEYGIWAVCSCIRTAQNSPIAGISIVAPIVRVNGKNKVEWTQVLIETVDEIMKRLA